MFVLTAAHPGALVAAIIPGRRPVLRAAALDPSCVMVSVDRVLLLPGIPTLAMFDVGSSGLFLLNLRHEALLGHSRLEMAGDTNELGVRYSPAGRRLVADQITLTLNGQRRSVSSAPDTPLLYVLTDELALQGPRFGCGLGQCGSCSVLVNDVEMRSCQLPLSTVAGKSVTTLEGLPAWYAAKKKLATVPDLHPVQQALLDEQALQCGYCFNGMIIKASELLAKTPQPSEAQIRAAMNGHLCRCGTYPRVIKAISRAAAAMRRGADVAASRGSDLVRSTE